MPSHHDIATLARLETQRTLAAMPQFQRLSRPEQLAYYKQALLDKQAELSSQYSVAKGGNGDISRAMLGIPGLPIPGLGGTGIGGANKAGDLIDDKRHENKRIDQAGQLAGDFVQNVDFPKFVRDLLKGVFDANLQVTLQQMQAYQNLLKTATQSIAKFVKDVDDAAAFGYLAENNSDDFSLANDEEEKDDDGSPKQVLADKDGNKLDLDDNAIKAKIMDAKLQMAREQRALLRETILMGITRLVVKKGVVKASVLFDIKASEKINKSDKAAVKESHASGDSVSAGGGFIGAIFGSPKAGRTSSDRKTQISLSSAKSTSSTDLAAKLAGSVEIEFFSDYFKLDNFAEMYKAGTSTSPMAPGAPAGAAPQAALPAGSK